MTKEEKEVVRRRDEEAFAQQRQRWKLDLQLQEMRLTKLSVEIQILSLQARELEERFHRKNDSANAAIQSGSTFPAVSR